MRVAKAAKHQSPDSEDHEANTIGMCDMESRADTCCVGNKWSLLSTIGQLCIVKTFHNSYEAVTNVPVGRAATSVLHDYGNVYIFILNEALFFGN